MSKSTRGFPPTKKQRPTPVARREMARCRKVLGALKCESIAIRAADTSMHLTDGESVHVIACLKL